MQHTTRTQGSLDDHHKTALCELLAKGTDASVLREMIGFAAERLMELGGRWPNQYSAWRRAIWKHATTKDCAI